MQRAATQVLANNRELSREEIENKSFDVYHHIMRYCTTPEERAAYFDQLIEDDSDIRVLQQTRSFIEAKRLIKCDANRTESFEYVYPGNQQASDEIRYVDRKRKELANDPEVKFLTDLRDELSAYIAAKKTQLEAQRRAARQEEIARKIQAEAISVTNVNLHRLKQPTSKHTGKESSQKKPKH